jgi:hypothetical protein
VHVVSFVMPVDVRMLEDMPCKGGAEKVHVIAQTEYQSHFGVTFSQCRACI